MHLSSGIDNRSVSLRAVKTCAKGTFTTGSVCKPSITGFNIFNPPARVPAIIYFQCLQHGVSGFVKPPLPIYVNVIKELPPSYILHWDELVVKIRPDEVHL